ncbi:MAG: hypothetical protein M3Z09_04700 [Acidobacteriota bacterium]|nr:hypothetical protein [Acidobacteriota bacterium]
MNKIGFAFALLFSTYSFGAIVSTCPTNGNGGILLTEAAEAQGEPATPTCMLPGGFASTTIPFALALNEAPGAVPPLISDVVLFAPGGLITFFSDPAIPIDLTINATQTEAAQNFITVAGVNYTVISDVGDANTPEVPEPSTVLLTCIPVAILGIRKFVTVKIRQQ